MSLVLLVHVFATLCMVGLIWTIQLVHYPLMADVRQGFVHYHERHCARITWLVGPWMGAEGLTAVLLYSAPPAGVDPRLTLFGLVLVVVNTAATALLSAPLHNRLGRGFDQATVAKLVATNWIRTMAWSVRGVLVLWMVWQVGAAA